MSVAISYGPIRMQEIEVVANVGNEHFANHLVEMNVLQQFCSCRLINILLGGLFRLYQARFASGWTLEPIGPRGPL